MKKLILPVFMTLILTGCGEGVDQKAHALAEEANKALAAGGGGEDGDKKNLISGDCPVINGKYVRDEDKEDSSKPDTVVLVTKVEDGKYSYGNGSEGNLFLADGEERRYDTADIKSKVKVTCDNDSVTVVTQEDGFSPQTTTYSLVPVPGEARPLLKVIRSIDRNTFTGLFTKVE